MILSENELNSQNLNEFTELLKEFQKLKVSRFIEIGSLYGWTLQHFIHYSEESSTAVAIDLPVRHFVGPYDWRVQKQESNYKNVWPKWAKEKKCKLYLLPTSSYNEETIKQVKTIFKGDLVDFVFIDGDHRYDAIKKDYEMYSPLVRPGGIVAFHDIGKNEEGGGSRFWNEIKINYRYKEFLFDSKNEKGIGVLFL
jgi:cephalosporin hydroxylase